MVWVEPLTKALRFAFSRDDNLERAKTVTDAYPAAEMTTHFGGFPGCIYNQRHWALAKTKDVYEWCFSQRATE